MFAITYFFYLYRPVDLLAKKGKIVLPNQVAYMVGLTTIH